MECNHRHFLLNIADSISAAPGSHRTTIPADAGRAGVAVVASVRRTYSRGSTLVSTLLYSWVALSSVYNMKGIVLMLRLVR